MPAEGVVSARLAVLLCAALLWIGPSQRARALELTFYYPIAVGGPIARLVDQLASDFEREHPGIKVKPVHAGSYLETLSKAQTALRAGQGPHLAVLLASDLFSLIDDDLIVPIGDLIPEGEREAWLDGFLPALLANSRAQGRTWSVPFQRSTVVLYWNKAAFRDAGLDPERPPATWDETVAMSGRLTRRDADGHVVQWGMHVPSSAFPYAMFQCFATQNDARLASPDGTQAMLDQPAVIEALAFWTDLSRRHHVHPPGIVEWGTAAQDFLQRKVAMTWVTTGNLAFIRDNARFEFGVAMLPAHKRRGSVPGGGNFYVFRNTTPEERAAATTFIRWATAPERAARWSIDTGYIAVTKAAWQTPAMRDYVARFPAAAVARDQLAHVEAEFSTHENQRVAKAFNDGIQAALTGAKTPAQAMRDAQREADRLLRPYRP
ncbi:MAG: ABC transporter substrate-binding protein [Alphaproteobacteria bacterium]|nr:ABC transporter substrate-binding protein [Alphaproteobacteria bacterium]